MPFATLFLPCTPPAMDISVWTIQACICNMFSYRQTIICANLLSNTAQALTSYVEALQDASNATDPLPFLEEALELFQKCLEYQEFQHQEFREQSAAAARLVEQETDTDDGGVSLTTSSTMDVDSEPGMCFSSAFECPSGARTLRFYPFQIFSLVVVHFDSVLSAIVQQLLRQIAPYP
jgi:hypothetical protein